MKPLINHVVKSSGTVPATSTKPTSPSITKMQLLRFFFLIPPQYNHDI